MLKRAVVFVVFLFAVQASVYAQSAPSDIPGLTSWLRADSVRVVDGQVDLWYDQSGEGHHAFQTAIVSRPEYNPSNSQIANNPTVDFDGAADKMDFDSVLNIVHMFAVVSYDLPLFDNNDGLITASSGSSSGSAFRGTANTALLRTSGFFGNTIKSNGITTVDFTPLDQFHIYSGNRISQYAADLVIGRDRASSATSWQGEIAEVLIYSNSLSEDEEQEIMEYLYDRYGSRVSIGDDVNLSGLCDTTLRISANTFDNVTWSDGSIADTLNIQEPGTYWASGTDVFGNLTTDTINVFLPGVPIESFVLCAGLDSVWMTEVNTDIYTIDWNVPNTGPSITISEGGDYQYTVTDMNSCSMSSEIVSVELDTFPIIATLGADTQLCAGNFIELIEGAELAVEYFWNEEMGGPQLEVNTTGEYIVAASDNNGCLAHDTISVTILGMAPEADFGFSNICHNDFVQFVDNSIAFGGAEIESYSWDFGDGEASDLASPQHQFDNVDTYGVTLTIVTDEGCEDELSRQVIIQPLPTSFFSFSGACAGEEIQFIDTSIVESGFIQASNWIFDGASPQSGAIVSHTFQATGDFEVQLITSTDFGCMDTLIQELQINGTPTSLFSADSVCLGNPTFFVATPDESESGPVNQYLWDFGGFTSIFESTTYTFQNPGLNPVELTVTSALGCSHDTLLNVVVSEDPQVQFESTQACEGEPVFFTDLTSTSPGDQVAEWTWFFNNQTESNLSSPSFVFESQGVFDVSLNVLTNAGCESQVEQEITVSSFPVSDFSFEPSIGAPPLTPVFDNFSTGGLSYNWMFDFGNTSNDFIPVHTFTDSGLVSISLEVINQAGCSTTSTDVIFLTEPITDLVLVEMDHVIENNFLQPTLAIRNIGNYDIESFVIDLQVTDGPRIQELWTGQLARDEVIIYPMNSSVYFDLAADIPFYCAEIIPTESRVDSDLSNNLLCKEIGTVEDEVFFLAPSPNPVSDKLNFSLINAKEGAVNVTCYDMMGKEVINRTMTNSGELVQEFELNFSDLPNGRYLLRIIKGLEERVYKIQVLRD